ncbi:MAG: hypothetical protein NZ959_09375 [Armatimonadetes bacterium]|nr:hypothetical protein [Armatimonadota bacterium]MDW8122164.1 hypothetical protein [Armatimonadota bacterium]
MKRERQIRGFRLKCWHGLSLCLVSIALLPLSVGVTVGNSGDPQDAWTILDARPFSGRARGVVGGLSVQLGQRLSARQAIYERDQLLAAKKPRLIKWLVEKGIWRDGQRLGLDLMVVPPISVERQRSRQVFGPGRLTFRMEGFPDAVAQRIASFLTAAMPVLIEVYGQPVTTPPHSDRQVTIVLDELLDALDGGVYNSVADEIRIPEFVPGRAADWFNLVHQVFHAFRGPLLLSFPAWEEGMARAAAHIACIRLRNLGFSELRNFDPKDPFEGDPLWILPLYDWLNQPALGNALFLGPSGFEPMAFWRIGMSAATWLKVAAENPAFFRLFNQSLVAATDPLSLRGDTPALADLTAALVPTVEGLTFSDWFRKQWVLNTGISVGPKLFVFAVPQHIGILLIIHYFRTTPEGDEQGLSGSARLVYRNDQSDDLYAEEGNEADVLDGEGFIAPQFFNIGGPNLIFIDLFVNNLMTTIPFPYMVRGEEPSENPIWGGIVGSLSGSVRVIFNDMTELTATVRRGVFAITQGLDVAQPYRLQVSHQDEVGFSSSLRINSAFDITGLILFSRPAPVTKTVSLPPGIHLFSVPLFPRNSDEASALGIAPNQLLLARWNPTRPGVNKYELYPRISTPMAPGVGYWLKVLRETTITVEGAPVSPDLNYEVPLFGGFNQLGNPYPDPPSLPVSALQVAFGLEGPLPLDIAEQRGWVQKTIWTWSPQTGYRIAESVEPWQGFWIRCLRPSGVRLIFPAGRSQRRSPSAAFATGDGAESLGPYVSFRLEAPGSPPDSENRLGLATGQEIIQVFKPPPVPGTLYGGFVPDRVFRSAGERELLSYDLKPNSSRLRWHFLVRSDLPNKTTAQLTWSGSKQWSPNFWLTMTDPTAGHNFSLHQRSAYSFTLAPGEERLLIIEARRGNRLPLVTINSLRSDRGKGLSLVLTVAGPARVRTEVFTVSGRRVGLLDDRFVPSVASVPVQWNGRMEGSFMPRGVYLLRVTAEDLEGRRFQAVRTVSWRW